MPASMATTKIAAAAGSMTSAAMPGPGQSPAIPQPIPNRAASPIRRGVRSRSEEHTSELKSLMRISYAVFCLKKKNKTKQIRQNDHDATERNEHSDQLHSHT